MASDTRDRILDEARKLLNRGGAASVTMRPVGDAVGITAAGLYRHFAGRDGVLNALADEGFAELAGRLAKPSNAGSVDKRMSRLLETNLDFALEKPHLFELMFLLKRQGARQFPRDFEAGRSPTANAFAALILEGELTGVFRKVPVWEVVFESGALLQGLVLLYLGGRISAKEEEFRTICRRALGRYFDGIRK
jgi:AcrR family transcriptional regulator